MKIIVLTNTMEGGVGQFVSQLSKLNKYVKNSSVQILSLQKPKHKKNISSSLTVDYFGENRSILQYSFKLSIIKLFISELFWLLRLLWKIKPSIVLSIDTHANFLLCLAKILYFQTIPAICTNHINTTDTAKNRLSKPLSQISKQAGRFLYRNANLITAVSKGVALDMKSFYQLKRNIITIYNGIPLKQKSLLTKPSHKKIITICRLVEQKDVSTLIKAFSLIQKTNPLAHLQIVGEGPLKNDLLNLTKQLRLEKKISFLGWVDNPSAYLEKSDIFVLSSLREGFPYVLLDAMSLGKPIISTNAPFGPKELLGNNEYGILVPVKNEYALFKAINKLLNNKELYIHYSQKATLRIKDFSEDSMLKNYSKVITKLIKK